jgi:DNA-binding XRE family transcriptional regulator
MLVANDFAARLKELREEAGISQYALAKAAGISKQAVNMLERGSNEPSWETVRKLARALKLDVTAFDVGELTVPGFGEDAADEPDDIPPPPPKKPAPKKPKR